MTDNPPVRIYVNKIESRITFRITSGNYLELLGSSKSMITEDENGENVSHLEVTEAVLNPCNVVTNNHQRNSGVSYTFVPIWAKTLVKI